MNISQLAIKYSRITIAFWVGIAVTGIIALNSLQYNLFPDVTFPVIVIRAQSQVNTVVETEQQLTIPIELALKDLPGLANIESTTYRQQILVNLSFDTGIDINEAVDNVDKNLKKVSFLTETTWKVIPFNLNESTAVSYVLISESYSLLELANIAKSKVIPAFQDISEVQKVNILGKSEQNLVHFNGKNAVALQIVKTAKGNTLEIVRQVAQITDKLQQQLTDTQLVLAETQAKYIQEATQATIDALVSAIAISVITIFAFLKNWRATLITAIAIPISLLGTFIAMAIAGFNLETLTLLALALVIGIIVDDAIVEVENIIRHLEEGQSPNNAALLATHEIGVTVSVSTLTIVAVFLPIALMGGTLGQFFRPFGLTISVAVLTSLLVARTLSPVLAVYFLKRRNHYQQNKNDSRLINLYRGLLSWSLYHRQQVIAIAIAVSLGGVALIPLIPQGFIPSLDRGEFNILYQTSLPNIKIEKTVDREDRANSSSFGWLKKIAQSPEKILLRRTLKIGTQIEQTVLDFPEVESVYTVAGFRGQANQGKIYVKLKGDRSLKTDAVQENARQALAKIDNVDISVEDIPFVETGRDTPFKIALMGDNLEQLRQTAIAIKQRIELLPSLVDVTFTGETQDIETITRFNSQRVIYLTANLTKDSAIRNVTQQVLEIVEPLLFSGITIDTQGNSARSSKILKEFVITLGIAVLLMLAVLYLPFKRWLEPLVIGLSLPLAIIGSMLALLITQSDFGMISLIGLIFLLGLLDKNGILLMDYANQLRKAGIPRKQALIQTGTIRLRPILMTTASTVLGMLPIALGWGAGAELRQPMAVAIIGGLIASSLLSLIVIPVLYSLLEDRTTNN
ncbi:efflux RND transporter permease subunit [Hyella patelloides]|nr:efflux RND transporter permease subunit [Hyella patelloides]